MNAPLPTNSVVRTAPFEHISVSKVNLYRECPKKFYYKYYEKLPTKTTLRMMLGTSMDDGFMQPAFNLLIDGKELDIPALIVAYEEFMVAKMYEEKLSDHEMEEGMQLVKYIQTGFEPYLTYMQERFSKFLRPQLETKDWYPHEQSRFKNKGFLDLIGFERETGELVVIDFKCKSKNAVTVGDRFQMLTYGTWAAEEFDLEFFPKTELHIFVNVPQKSNPTIHRINKLEYTQQQIAYATEDFVELERAIELNYFPAHRYGQYCGPKSCDFYDRCFALV